MVQAQGKPLKSLRRILGEFSAGLFSHETVFGLFLCAGLFKNSPSLSWFPIDFTVFFGGLTVITGTWVVLRRGFVWKLRSLSAAYVSLLFFGYMGTTILWSPNAGLASYKALFMLPLAALSFLDATLVVAPEARRGRRLLPVFVGIGLLMLVETAVAYSRGTMGMGLEFASSDYISVGRLLGVTWLIVYSDLILHTRSLAAQAVELVLLAGCGFGLLIIGARQTLLAVAIVALIPLLGVGRLRSGLASRRTRWMAALVIVAGIVGVYVLQGLGVEMSTLNRFAVLFSGGSRSTDVRVEYWSFVLQNWGTHALTGHGLSAFGIENGITPVYRGYPHNLILELLFEGGILGLFLFAGLFGICVTGFQMVRREHEHGFTGSVVIMLVLFLGINLMVSSTYADERTFFAMLGLLCQPTASSAVPKINGEGVLR